MMPSTSVDSHRLAAYLASTGWIRKREARNGVVWAFGDQRSVVVPWDDLDSDDQRELAQVVIMRLADVENREPEEVVRDLAKAAHDTIDPRSRIRELMRGVPDSEDLPGMRGDTGAEAVQTVIRERLSETYANARHVSLVELMGHVSLVELMDYAFGYALALNGERVPLTLDEGVRPEVFDGHRAGRTVPRASCNPAPVEAFAR